MDIAIEIQMFDGSKVAARFPTDEEWAARTKSRKLVRISQHGETRIDVEGGDRADLDLFRAITDNPEFSDVDTAALAIEKLAEGEVLEIVATGEGLEVQFRWFGGTEEIQFAKPSAAHVRRHRGFVTMIDLGRGRTELRTSPSIPVRIFDELAPNAKALPMIHKITVVSEVLSEAQRVLAPSDRP